MHKGSAMNEYDSISKTRQSFEEGFTEPEARKFYNSQTQDEEHLNRILSVLATRKGGRILDLGCGSGYLSFPLAAQNPYSQVVGLDIVNKTLENNRQAAKNSNLSNLDFVSYDGITFPFENSSFDTVVSRYALHHFPDIRKAFAEISRVLRKGGQFFLSDPTPDACDKNRFVDAFMRMKDDGHIKFYTMEEFERLASSVGFKLENSFFSQIHFPRKSNQDYGNLLAQTDKNTSDSYEVEKRGGEIWITEQVLNLSFRKQ